MKHICMLCSGHSVLDARVTQKQATSLARLGCKVTVFGRGDGDTHLPGIPNLELRSLLPLHGNLFTRLRMLPKLYRAVVQARPDVITCHEPESALVGLLARCHCHVPVLFDIHECFQYTFSSHAPWGTRRLLQAATTFLLKSLGRRCDWLTVVSPYNEAFYKNIRRDGRVTLIHNSPPQELFPTCDQDVSGPITVCHEGYLDKSRGMTQILEAIALARQKVDVRLLIIGKIREECQPLFDHCVANLSLGDFVIVPGWKPYAEIGRLEATAQIGLVTLQPSVNAFKSLNNKLYNYMCCGQPVIVPANSVTAEMVRQYDCGLIIDTTKPEEIAAAMVRLAMDSNLRKHLGANGRHAIENHLNWHEMEKTLSDIYAQLLAESC